MEYTNEALQAKSKTELIEIATALLKEKYPERILNTNDFDIRVWNNNYGSIKVIFIRAIRYATNETDATNYNISIDLISKEITPFNDPDLPFYTPSKEANKTIAALKEKGLLPKNNQPDVEYTFTENAAYHLISCFDNLYEIDKNAITNQKHPYISKTLVNKKTGDRLYFKGRNPFYYLSQMTTKHYYQENLYAVLKAKNTSNHDEIIKMATSILKEKQPDLKLDPNDYDIMILGNYKDLIVKYRRFVRFNKGNEETVFDLAVNIIIKEISPFNTSEIAFYKTTSSDKKTIKTLQNVLPLEHSANIEHTVSENNNYFFVTSIYESATKNYFISKNTNEIVWTNDAFTLQVNNREDLSLQENYKRMNGLFEAQSENNKPLENMTLAILNENQFSPNIKLDDYNIGYKTNKNEVEATLTRLVKFIPLRHKNTAKLDYDLKINLVKKTVAKNPAHFYSPTEEDNKTTKLIESKLADFLEGADKIDYPIEIIEDHDFFDITHSGSFNLGEYTNKKYRMDKKTKRIKEVISPINPIFPSPAMKPSPFKEIKD
ncbi:hypothetical protein [Tamlana sp. I1]|uniref:hypothetical protein n=1 Tax=Tamlana sp. I1 TaxID=2762061 RepID=UPI00188E0ABE|nr:hypothetical protein [Tamlana sp. I1]